MTKRPMRWDYVPHPSIEVTPVHTTETGWFSVPFGASEEEAVEAFRRAWQDSTRSREYEAKRWIETWAAADEEDAATR